MVPSLYSVRAPETKWEYNNFAYGMAGLLVQKISGRHFDVAIQQSGQPAKNELLADPPVRSAQRGSPITITFQGDGGSIDRLVVEAGGVAEQRPAANSSERRSTD